MTTFISPSAARRAFTLLEVTISALILVGLLSMVGQAIVSGARTTEVANLKSDAVRQANGMVQRLGMELRYVAYQDVDGDGIPDPRFDGPVTSGDTQVYTYRIASGLSKSGPTYAKLCDRRLIWDQAKGSLTLTSYNADNPSLPANVTLLVTGGIPRTFQDVTPSGTTTEPGFAITRTGASLQLHLNIQLTTGSDTEQHQEWVSKQTAIFLRQSLATKGLVEVTSTTEPSPPVIDGPMSMSGTVGAALSFGIATSGGAATTYAAAGLPTGLSCNSSTGEISGIPGLAGTFLVTLTASNAYGEDTVDCTLTIAPAVVTGNPPVVTPANLAGQVRSSFSYQVIATNMANKNKPVGYEASTLPAGLSLDTATGVLSGTPTAAGTFTVVIAATNADGTGTASFILSILPAASSPPVIPTLTTISATVNTAFTFQIPATNMTASYGPVGYSLTSVPAGLTVNTSTGAVSGTVSTPQTVSMLATAVNADGQGSGTIQLVVTANPNDPTVSAGSVTATWGNPFQYVITATNMANKDHPVGYSASGLPGGLTIDSNTGAISGTPTDSGGTWQVKISATNGSGTGSNTLTITIPARVPSPPVVTAGSGSCSVNTAYSYQIVATNIGTLYAPISYEADGLPFGLLCDTAGKISGSPTEVGTFSVTLIVSNSDGKGSATLNLVVSDPNAPVVTGATVNGAQGSALTAQVAVSNVKHNDTLDYSASDLPPGLSINSATGAITGTPSADGTWATTITVVNKSQGGSTGSNVFTFIIASPQAPVLSPQSQSIYTSIAASFQIAATGMDAAYGPQGYTATGLPSGMSVNASTGVISGTATAAGTYSVTVTATNDGGTGSATLTITVESALTEVTITKVKATAPASGGKVNVAGSYFWVRPPTGYSMLPANITVTKSSTGGTLSYTTTSNPSGGYNVTLSGSFAAGTATVNATATKSGSANKTGTATLTFP